MSTLNGTGIRILVVPYAIPLESSGTSIVLRRLLEHFTSDEVVLLGTNPDPKSRLASCMPHYPVVRVPSPSIGTRGERYWRVATIPASLAAGAWAILRHRPDVILAVFPDEWSLLTAYVLHRLSGLPLLAYFCDLYMEDRRSWLSRLARWLQPRVFHAASRIIAVNEGMADLYRRRYQVDPVCLPTCINTPVPDVRPMPPPGRPFVVAYSGNVNATRVGSLRALVQAIGGNPAYRIRYFTPQNPGQLRSWGVWAENAQAEFIRDERELIGHLSACDALFMPLTFAVGENSRDQLATCFGIKSYEYFLSQRPILLHAPGDYFIARFYREWECGVVVSEPSAEALTSGLERLRDDEGLRLRLAGNALQAARQFEGARVAATLRALLEDVAGNDRGRRA